MEEGTTATSWRVRACPHASTCRPRAGPSSHWPSSGPSPSRPLPAAAEPAPATSREAADLIAARARDLEVLTEKFNEARERLKATERVGPPGRRRTRGGPGRAGPARDRVRVVARSAYTGDRLDPLQAMLTSNSPDDLLDRVGTLHAIAEHNDGVLGGAEQATHAADRAQAQAEEVAADAQRQVDRVAAQKKDLDAQIAVFKAAYDRLHAAEERASRAAAERRARDRAVAARAAAAARPAHAAPHAARRSGGPRTGSPGRSGPGRAPGRRGGRQRRRADGGTDGAGAGR